jgi:hypothetical protein
MNAKRCGVLIGSFRRSLRSMSTAAGPLVSTSASTRMVWELLMGFACGVRDEPTFGCAFSLPAPTATAAVATSHAFAGAGAGALVRALFACDARKFAIPPWLRTLRLDRLFPLIGRVGARATGAVATISVFGRGEMKESEVGTGEGCMVSSAPSDALGSARAGRLDDDSTAAIPTAADALPARERDGCGCTCAISVLATTTAAVGTLPAEGRRDAGGAGMPDGADNWAALGHALRPAAGLSSGRGGRM